MDQLRVANGLLAQNGTQAPAQAPSGTWLSQVSPMGVMQGVAMLGGGIFAVQSIPGAKKASQVALGMLGGGLLLAGALSVYDALS